MDRNPTIPGAMVQYLETPPDPGESVIDAVRKDRESMMQLRQRMAMLEEENERLVARVMHLETKIEEMCDRVSYHKNYQRSLRDG